MTCPRCFSEFEASRKACPECGVRLYQNVSGIVKTSVVMISSRGEDTFYQSVQDVPETLRRELMKTTASENSGTIVIADRAGKEQLTRDLSRRDAGYGVPPEASLPEADSPVPVSQIYRFSWLAWGGFALVIVLAAAISAFFGLRW